MIKIFGIIQLIFVSNYAFASSFEGYREDFFPYPPLKICLSLPYGKIQITTQPDELSHSATLYYKCLNKDKPNIKNYSDSIEIQAPSLSSKYQCFYSLNVPKQTNIQITGLNTLILVYGLEGSLEIIRDKRIFYQLSGIKNYYFSSNSIKPFLMYDESFLKDYKSLPKQESLNNLSL